MKCVTCKLCPSIVVSLPVRGAWVEILGCLAYKIGSICRSPCGERGLK